VRVPIFHPLPGIVLTACRCVRAGFTAIPCDGVRERSPGLCAPRRSWRCRIWFQFLQPILGGQAGAVFRPAHPAPPVIASPSTTLAALRAIRAKGTIAVPTFLEVRPSTSTHEHASH
jgi:hypothetical protein